MFGGPLHDYFEPSDTADSRGLLAGIAAAARAENSAAAARLAAIGELFEMRRRERGEHEDWAVDTWAAVGAEVAAALRVSLAQAGSYMNYGLAMRRLPEVAALFAAGGIDAQTFQTIVYRTELVADDEAMAAVDRRVAQKAACWPSMTRGRLAAEIDRIVARHDRDAVRRTRERTTDREVIVCDNRDGSADLSGRLFATDAQALDQRLDALAATVCATDPRTVAQRRADALGALAVGADRLVCRCGAENCPSRERPASPGVVIHLVADKATVEGRSQAPGYLLGADTLIPAELVAELAANAKLRPLIHPADAAAEPGYRPSRALSDFVRARDLTCRAPGCDRPATKCDLDHTIPYGAGGPTHASNLKCVCRLHHLLKTFWGWRDKQLPDGTVIWTMPGGQTYVTVPGSVWLFPSMATPSGPVIAGAAPPPADGEHTAMMPQRRTTRAQNRAHRIASERAHNRRQRQVRHAAILSAEPNNAAEPNNGAEPYNGAEPNNGDPPPF